MIGAQPINAGKAVHQGQKVVFSSIVFACLLWLTACHHELPEQALRNTVAQMQQAAEARDIDTLFESIDANFLGPEGMGRQTFRAYITAVILQNQKINVQLGPLNVQLFDQRAIVKFTAMASGGIGWLPKHAQIYQVETGWLLVDGKWQLISAKWEPKL